MYKCSYSNCKLVKQNMKESFIVYDSLYSNCKMVNYSNLTWRKPPQLIPQYSQQLLQVNGWQVNGCIYKIMIKNHTLWCW